MGFDYTQYTLRRVSQRSEKSSTRVAMGLLDAYIKYDTPSSYPDNVYNEIVALRLGHKNKPSHLYGFMLLGGNFVRNYGVIGPP